MCSSDLSATAGERLARHGELIRRLARVEKIAPLADGQLKGVAQLAVPEATLLLPLAGVIDAGAERARLSREIDKFAKEIAGIDKRLGNADFVAKADPEVVEDTRERRSELDAARARLENALQRIAGL